MTAKSRPTRWYYQINSEVRGPIDIDQLIQALMNGEIQINHRISADQRNWTAVCNEECIEDAIRERIGEITNSTLEMAEMQKEASLTKSNFQERTGTFDLKKVSLGISEQLKDAHELTESNHAVNTLRQLLSKIAVNRKKIITLEKPALPTRHVEDEDVFIEAPVKNQTSIWRRHRKSMSVTALLFVIAFGFYAFNQYQQMQILEKQRLEKDLAQKAIQDKILSYYDRVLQLPPAERNLNNAKALLDASQAMINANDLDLSQNVNARVLAQTKDKAMRARAFNLNGIIQMSKKDWPAACQEFEMSIKEDPSIAETYYSLGISFFNRDAFEESEKYLLKAYEVGANRILTTIALYELALKIENVAGNTKYDRLTRVDKILQENLKAQNDFKAELLIARINLARIINDPAEAVKLSREFINLNPELVQTNKLHNQTEYKPISWSNVYRWCTDAYSKSKNEALADVVLAGCLIHIQKPQDAVTFSKTAFQKLATDNSIKGILGYSMYMANLNEEAKSLFKNDNEKSLNRLALLALAHICEKEKTSDCALKYWTLLAQLDNSDPSAFIGVMNFYIEKNDMVSAKKTVEENISRQPASEELDRLSKRLKLRGLNLW